MAHQTIADFRGGMDTRKSIVSGDPGTLYLGRNVHVTPGGQVESRLGLIGWADLPTTKGLAPSASTLYTFGHGASPAMPPRMAYQQLTHPSAHAMVRVVASCMFAGLPYVLAEYANGDVLHFYNGASVAAWAPAGALYGKRATGCVTLGKKVHVIEGNTLHFSELDDPTKFNTGTNGAGNIDLSTHLGGSESLSAIAVYIDRLAVMSANTTQIWAVDPDPSKYALIQTLPNIGALSHGGVVSFGDSDVFLLARSGIRSLRTRDMSQANLASRYDIGAPIDSDVLAALVAAGDGGAGAQSVVEPLHGRYMLAIGQSVFVFSFFPAGKVSAWTVYDFGQPVTEAAAMGDDLFLRVGSVVCILGGPTHDYYDSSTYEVVLPMMDGKSPHTIKALGGIDVGCEGRWDIEIGANVRYPSTREIVARIDGPTWGDGRIPAGMNGTHFGLRLSGSTPARAVLERVVLHFAPYDDKDNGA